MKTLQEFSADALRYQTELKRNNSISSCSAIGGILLMGVAGMVLGPEKGHSLPPVKLAIAIAIPFLILGVILSGIMILPIYHRKLARRLGLFCPVCLQDFISADMKLVIATRNCPHCGKAAVIS